MENLPIAFIEQINKEFGEPQAGRLSELLNGPSPATVRVNPGKISNPEETLSLPLDTEVKMEGRSQ